MSEHKHETVVSSVDAALAAAPETVQGFPAFAPDFAHLHPDFPPDLFPGLARAEEKSFWFQGRNRIIQWLFRRFLGAETHDVLEVGCGTGFVLRGLATTFPSYRLTGAEVYSAGLRFAQDRVPQAHFCQLDATNMPFESLFDAIGCFDVLEHIPDDEAALRGIAKALKPDGFLFITVPQHMWLWSAYDEAGGHKRRYSRSELVSKVQAAGYQVLFVSSFVSLLLPLMFANRFLQKEDKRSRAEVSEQSLRDLTPSGLLNVIGSLCMRIDFFLLRLGLSLPLGGSLSMVVRKISQS
jgi:SAM-dependent methyltransferase